jgi:uncharacterized protein YfaS (alpha-2-macroglobulin family)
VGRREETAGAGGPSDQRLILLTDLGLLVKDSSDGSHDVFVQSIRRGAPMADVAVEILGRNGLPVLTRKTDADGRASFPTLKDFTRAQSPTVYVAEQGDDFSFIPYDRADRRLNLSRFDTGGRTGNRSRRTCSRIAASTAPATRFTSVSC